MQRDYKQATSEFSVAALERQVLSKPLSEGLNACFECCDRHAEPDKTALFWIGKAWERETLSFAHYRREASLRNRSMRAGPRYFTALVMKVAKSSLSLCRASTFR